MYVKRSLLSPKTFMVPGEYRADSNDSDKYLASVVKIWQLTDYQGPYVAKTPRALLIYTDESHDRAHRRSRLLASSGGCS